MTTTHDQHERPYPGREEIRALVGGLGPTTLFDLFEKHGVPEGERFRLIEEVLALLIVQGRPAMDLASWFVETLEGRCRTFVGGAGLEELEKTRGYVLVARVEYLCKASREEGARDPERAVELAERAVDLADQIDPTACGRSAASEQRILSRAWLGNARRLASDLHGAEYAFQECVRLLDQSELPSLVINPLLNLLDSVTREPGDDCEGARPSDPITLSARSGRRE